MQYKLEKTINGWRFTLGNITTFLTDDERKELIAALIYEDPGLADRMARYLESGQFRYCLPICLKVIMFLTDVDQFYGWKSNQTPKDIEPVSNPPKSDPSPPLFERPKTWKQQFREKLKQDYENAVKEAKEKMKG